MTTHLTPQRVLELKAEAKAMVAAGGIKHAKALLQIANREGYRDWRVLVAMAGGSQAIDDARPISAHAMRKAERHKRYQTEEPK